MNKPFKIIHVLSIDPLPNNPGYQCSCARAFKTSVENLKSANASNLEESNILSLDTGIKRL